MLKKQINSARIYNTHKYIDTQQKTTQIYRTNNVRLKGRHNSSGEFQHPAFINGHISQTENQKGGIRIELYY